MIDHPLGIRGADIVEQLVLAAGELGELVHLLLDDRGRGLVELVDRLAALEVDIRVLRCAAEHRAVRGEGAGAVRDQLIVDHGASCRPRSAPRSSGLRARCGTRRRNARTERGSAGSAAWAIRAKSWASWTLLEASMPKPVWRTAMTSEWSPKIESAWQASDAGRHVEDRRRELAGDLVHVRDHQQQALGGRERGGQRAGGQGAVHRAGGAAFGLQFADMRDRAPDILLAGRAALIGNFAHRRGGSDRINRNHLVRSMRYVGDRVVAVNRYHLLTHHALLLAWAEQLGRSDKSGQVPGRNTVENFEKF